MARVDLAGLRQKMAAWLDVHPGGTAGEPAAAVSGDFPEEFREDIAVVAAGMAAAAMAGRERPGRAARGGHRQAAVTGMIAGPDARRAGLAGTGRVGDDGMVVPGRARPGDDLALVPAPGQPRRDAVTAGLPADGDSRSANGWKIRHDIRQPGPRGSSDCPASALSGRQDR